MYVNRNMEMWDLIHLLYSIHINEVVLCSASYKKNDFLTLFSIDSILNENVINFLSDIKEGQTAHVVNV